MSKRMEILGICPHCNREVTNDMRPLSVLNRKDIKKNSLRVISKVIENDLKDCPSVPLSPVNSIGSSDWSVEQLSPLSNFSLIASKPKTATSKPVKEPEEEESIALLTGTVLNLVKEEFERPAPSVETAQISRENAEAIMALLQEEELIFLDKKDNFVRGQTKQKNNTDVKHI